jgi:hypothetical protein
MTKKINRDVLHAHGMSIDLTEADAALINSEDEDDGKVDEASMPRKLLDRAALRQVLLTSLRLAARKKDV